MKRRRMMGAAFKTVCSVLVLTACARSEEIASPGPIGGVLLPPAWTTTPAPTLRETSLPTPTPTEIAPAPLPAEAWRACEDAPFSRLQVRRMAFVGFVPSLPVRVRDEPKLDSEAVLGLIYPGNRVEVVDGPQCDSGMVWWKVQTVSRTLVGWAAEGDDFGYWIVPIPKRLDLSRSQLAEQQVVFSSSRDGLQELYRVTFTVSDDAVTLLDLQRFMPTIGNATHAAWSPRGDEIAFLSNRDGDFYSLYLLQAGGGLSRLVPEPPPLYMSPVWSPDGDRLAYACGVDICIVDREGDVMRLTPGALPDSPLGPTWSPDGSRLAFYSNNGEITVYTIRRDGSEQVPVISLPGYGAALSWSPNGEWIGIASYQTGLYIVRPDGSDLHQLDGHAMSLAWSPDGVWLTYPIWEPGDTGFRIVLLNVGAALDQGADPLLLVDGENWNGYPAWGPVGAPAEWTVPVVPPPQMPEPGPVGTVGSPDA